MNWKRCFSIASARSGGAKTCRASRWGGIVTQRRLGTAGEFPVEEALSKVLPRLQAEFDLGAED